MSRVRDSNGIWLDTSVFRETGAFYKKNGFYCDEPWGSPTWYKFWYRERSRCINGYTVDGVKITGDHYHYLNFCPIKLVEDNTKTKSKKISSFPDFWDGDFNYFWFRNIAKYGVVDAIIDSEKERKRINSLSKEEEDKELLKIFKSLKLFYDIEVKYMRGGWNLIVGKSRRRGYSYKNAAIASNNYFTKPNSHTLFGAYEKKYLYPKGICSMAIMNINFINENTGWVMPSDYIQRPNHYKSSYAEKHNGVYIEKGFLSEVSAETFKDNPDAIRGKDIEDLFFEESGAFGTPGLLKESYASSQDCVTAGAIKTGMITVFGTSGDMEGGTYDYADMFQRPEAFGFLPFNDIWGVSEDSGKIGFFHPINWNTEGYYDKQGNSDTESAKNLELDIRKKLIKNGATSIEIQKRMQERPLNPNEAFSSISVNNFPVAELKKQLSKVKSKGWQEIKGTPVNLVYEKGVVKSKPILDASVTPITSYHHIPTNKRGCPVIYEYPVNNTPRGLYKIGYDPIRQEIGSSLASIVVYKSLHKSSVYHSNIVAEYVGRYEDPDDIDRIAYYLSILYNTTIMYENEVTSVKNYFRRIKKLHHLTKQPDLVISKNIKNSRTSRVYGCHMTSQLKDAGERYIKSWLLTVLDYDENGNAITVVDRIYSIRLLEELIAYSRKGNFDLISALIMCMFQVQEEELGKEFDSGSENNKVKSLLSMIGEMYN